MNKKSVLAQFRPDVASFNNMWYVQSTTDSSR